MRIRFNIKHATSWGQRLCVVGSCPELGIWDTDGSVEMSCFAEGEWEAEADFAGCISEFEYKYIIKDGSGGLIWEPGDNRRFLLDAQTSPAAEHSEFVDVCDRQRDFSGEDSLFLTSAFRDVIFARKKDILHKEFKKARYKNISGTTVCVQVTAPRIGRDDALHVLVAGQKHDKKSAAEIFRMDDSEFPLWKTSLTLDKGRIPFDYKYVIKDKNGKIVHEEPRYRSAGRVKTAESKGSKRKPKSGNAASSADRMDGAAGLLVVTDNNIEYENRWRGSGVAVPVFSLRSKDSLGTGEFLDLKPLADWASGCGFRIIQLLPVNDTTVTMTWRDSYPYANVSVFALHPIYLNLQAVNCLPDKMMDEIRSEQQALNGYGHVEYEKVLETKIRLARKIFDHAKISFLASDEFKTFFKENRYWLEPYAAFSALRDRYRTSDHLKWERYSAVTEDVLHSITASGSPEYGSVAFYYFLQYHLHIQLSEASDYAKSKHVVLKGDIPIGIHKHSDSCWLHPRLFNMDQSAGAPPDPFSDVGQNWGFPTYDWDAMKDDGYSWWRMRLGKMSEYFQMIRLDHILGFFRIWEIPDVMTSGLMGHFNPAIPLGKEELEFEGIWDFDRLSEPYIPSWLLRVVFGKATPSVASSYLDEVPPGHYKLKSQFDTQRKIEDNVRIPSDAPAEVRQKMSAVKSGLSFLISNIVLLRDARRPGFHPRINAMDTPSFDCLDGWMKEKLSILYNDYFYKRQDDFWRQQAMSRLPVLKAASDMLICGEDLGMVPDCVGPVMEDLRILGLRIQRMPKEPGVEFADPAGYPYLSVCTTSSHDMPTIRGWWEEDRERSLRYWKRVLRRRGNAPAGCDPETVKEIIKQHLESPSMWAIFPMQDLLAISPKLRRPGDARDEQINDPAEAHHYWKFRLHISLEELLGEAGFTADLHKMVTDAGRAGAY